MHRDSYRPDRIFSGPHSTYRVSSHVEYIPPFPPTEVPRICLGVNRTLATGIHLSSLEYLLVCRWSKVGHSPEESNRVIT